MNQFFKGSRILKFSGTENFPSHVFYECESIPRSARDGVTALLCMFYWRVKRIRRSVQIKFYLVCAFAANRLCLYEKDRAVTLSHALPGQAETPDIKMKKTGDKILNKLFRLRTLYII
jgi:hypothetical protein